LFPPKGGGDKIELTVKFPDVPVVRMRMRTLHSEELLCVQTESKDSILMDGNSHFEALKTDINIT